MVTEQVPRVVLAMAANLYREGLREALSATGCAATIAECRDWACLIPLVQMERADVIVVSFPLAGVASIESLKELLFTVPSARVIVVLGESAPPIAIPDLLRHGVAGVINSNAHFQEFKSAIMQVHNNCVVIGTELLCRLVQAREVVVPQLTPTISPTEKVILSLVVQGKKDLTIAKELGVSRRTVQEHLRRIYKKLGASNRAHASAIALQGGIILPVEYRNGL